MSRPLPARDEVWSAEDYLGWPSDTPHCELIDGRVYAMSPAPTLDHQQIALTFASELRISLRSRRGQDGSGGNCRCQVFIAPTDVRLDSHTVVQPDVLVVCDPAKLANGRHVDGAPDLVVEVLSPSTEKDDRTEKLDFYRSLPSVMAIVMVWQDQRRAQVVERDGERWIVRDLIGGGFEVAALGLALSLDEIYAGIDLPAEGDDA